MEKPGEQTSSLTHASVLPLLRPHLSPTGEVQMLGAGDFCLTFLQGETVVRVARHAEAAAALQRETTVLNAVAAHLPLPVPRLSYHAPPQCPPFTRHRLIAGTELTGENWVALTPAFQDQIAAELAGFLRALHAQPLDTAQAAGLETLCAAAWARKLHAASGALATQLDTATWQRLACLLAQWSQAPALSRPVLLHRDLAPGHLFFAPDTGHLTGVIDFGDLALGEAARDFVYLYDDFGAAFLAAVLRHYGPLEPSSGETPEAAVRRWYLLETLAWTLDLLQAQNPQWREGYDVLVQELKR